MAVINLLCRALSFFCKTVAEEDICLHLILVNGGKGILLFDSVQSVIIKHLLLKKLLKTTF